MRTPRRLLTNSGGVRVCVFVLCLNKVLAGTVWGGASRLCQFGGPRQAVPQSCMCGESVDRPHKKRSGQVIQTPSYV